MSFRRSSAPAVMGSVFTWPLALAVLASPSHASGLTGDTLDAVAEGMSWFVITCVPIAVLVLFWIVHVMPEKIAHKRHHPQTKAIQVLCLLSLAFGGLLWPLAWLWAYTRPIGYRMAYGTDKHEDYHAEMGARADAGELTPDELAHLRDELDSMNARGALTPALVALRARLAARAAVPAPAAATVPTTVAAAVPSAGAGA